MTKQAEQLARAAHVIVNFQSAGALWVRRTRNGPVARLIFDPVRLKVTTDANSRATSTAGNRASPWVWRTTSSLTTRAGTRTQRPTPARARLRTPSWVEPSRRHPSRHHRAATVARAWSRCRRKEEGRAGEGKGAAPGGIGVFPSRISRESSPPCPPAFSCPTFLRPASERAVGGPSSGAEAAAPSQGSGPTPLVGLAKLAAVYGTGALSHVPTLRMGKLFTVDRAEIEKPSHAQGSDSRTTTTSRCRKNLSQSGVFGPPGAGKSFGVRALAEDVLGEKVPFLEFNLSQFKDPDDLALSPPSGSDEVLKGATPVAFWDEFDSQNYRWLQYLLAPMQDGAFQEREITHPIGKCVFVFAGGTSPTIDMFGVAKPTAPTRAQLRALSLSDRAAAPGRFDKEVERYQDFRMLKGPDFVSRLHGFLNVLGPSARATDPSDISWPVRRASLLRTLLGVSDGEWLDIDPGLLHALLSVRALEHGARSLEKIVGPLRTDKTTAASTAHRCHQIPCWLARPMPRACVSSCDGETHSEMSI